MSPAPLSIHTFGSDKTLVDQHGFLSRTHILAPPPAAHTAPAPMHEMDTLSVSSERTVYRREPPMVMNAAFARAQAAANKIGEFASDNADRIGGAAAGGAVIGGGGTAGMYFMAAKGCGAQGASLVLTTVVPGVVMTAVGCVIGASCAHQRC